MFEVKLGKLIFEEIISKRVDSNDLKNSSYYSDEYFSEIGKNLIKNTDLFIEIMNKLNVNLNIKEDKNYNNLKEVSVYELITIAKNAYKGDFKYKHINKAKCLGELAWHFIANKMNICDTYINVLSSDISYIEENAELIWNNINNSKKDLVENYLLNHHLYQNDEETEVFVLYEIESAIRKILSNNLKYYYLYNCRWDKLSNLGKMIWYMAMKHNSRFANIVDKLESEESFDLYMEALANNISPQEYFNNGELKRVNIHDNLYVMLKTTPNCHYTEWDKSNWDNCLSLWTNEVYNTMITATNDMLIKHLSHLAKWDEHMLQWVLIDNEEAYYLELSKKALNGYIDYEVYNSDSIDCETIDVCFKDVKNFGEYQPITIIWFDADEVNEFSSRSSETITDIISMNDEGYSCGLDIAYNGAACSKKTEPIMNNLLKLVNKKGYNYKLKEKAIDKSNKNDNPSYKSPVVYNVCNKTSINVNFDSNLEVLEVENNSVGKLFTLSCMLPYLNSYLNTENKLEILTKIKVLYTEKYDKYSIVSNFKEEFTGVNEDDLMDKLIGINKDELINKVSNLCSTYMKNKEYIAEL